MKILHTSDWHLGRGISQHDLRDAQQAAIDHIVETAIARNVDVVVVAGDVFDVQRPNVDELLMLRNAMERIHAAGIKIIITAGNHDSGPRLAATASLLKDGVHIVGMHESVGQPIEIHDEHGPVLFYPLPYLEPNEARYSLAPEPVSGGEVEPLGRSHQAVLGAAMDKVRAHFESRTDATRAVAIAHAFVIYGETSAAEQVEEMACKSERDLSVGGIQYATSDIFKGMSYVALGHIHGPKVVNYKGTPAPHIRYSGSILRYSISERNHQKSFAIVDIDSSGVVTEEHVEVVPIPQPYEMAKLEGTVEQLTSSEFAKHFQDFVEIVVTDEALDDQWRARLDAKYPRILSAFPKRRMEETSEEEEISRDVENPIQLVERYVTLSLGQAPTEEMSKIIEAAYETAVRGVSE